MNPDDNRRYRSLTDALGQVGRFFARELPPATASLHLHARSGSTTLDVYDKEGKIISRLPDLRTSQSFRDAIERLGRERCPDSDGIVCPIILK